MFIPEFLYCVLVICCLVLLLVQRALFPKRVSREELAGLVDRAADLIRTAVDYKFILVLLILKTCVRGVE